MTVTVGRIVHVYRNENPDPLPAIVTRVYPETNGLTINCFVFHDLPGELTFMQRITYAATPTPGHWTWPPRVEEGQGVGMRLG